MNNAREHAHYLYTKFQQYYWHEVDGFMPDDTSTKKVCNTHLELIMDYCNNKEDIEFFKLVKKEINLI